MFVKVGVAKRKVKNNCSCTPIWENYPVGQVWENCSRPFEKCKNCLCIAQVIIIFLLTLCNFPQIALGLCDYLYKFFFIRFLTTKFVTNFFLPKIYVDQKSFDQKCILIFKQSFLPNILNKFFYFFF